MIYRGLEKKPIINNGDYAYEVIAELNVLRVNNPSEIKKKLKCDLVLHNKKQNTYLFSRRIQDAIIIDDSDKSIDRSIDIIV